MSKCLTCEELRGELRMAHAERSRRDAEIERLYTKTVYPTARTFDTEGDLYESITGRRSAVLDEAKDAEIERLKAALSPVHGLPPGLWEVRTSYAHRQISCDGDLSWSEQQCQALCDLVNGIRAALEAKKS